MHHQTTVLQHYSVAGCGCLGRMGTSHRFEASNDQRDKLDQQQVGVLCFPCPAVLVWSGMPGSVRAAKTLICNSTPCRSMGLPKGSSSPTRHRGQSENDRGWMLAFTNFVAAMSCWFGDSIGWDGLYATWSHWSISSKSWVLVSDPFATARSIPRRHRANLSFISSPRSPNSNGNSFRSEPKPALQPQGLAAEKVGVPR